MHPARPRTRPRARPIRERGRALGPDCTKAAPVVGHAKGGSSTAWTRPLNDGWGAGLRPGLLGSPTGQETVPIGSRRAPGAASGTTGFFGATGDIRWYDEPSSGRGSASPLFGQNAIARSAWAVIVSDGFTPRLAE